VDGREIDVDGQERIQQGVVREILDLEWEMFQEVRGLDGPAPCQQDRGTFEIMRSSQLSSWNQEIAESYLDDLRQARAGERNLMTEKYARMMESTSPCECRGLGAVVPVLDENAARLVARLADLSVRWMEEVAVKYPLVSARGRPIRACEDSRFTTSFETYNRGELATYSSRTLRLLEDHYLQTVAGGINPAELIMEHTMASYGFASLEEAEAALRAREERTGGRPA
jgi:hypothetical protein